METEISSSPLPIIFCSLLFFIILIKTIASAHAKSKNLPPGPRKLPILGNLHQLVTSLPHQKLRELSLKCGPIMHLQLGEIPTVVVSSPEFAKEVMKTHDIVFASRPFNLTASILMYNSSDIVFSPYGDHWRQLRKICVLELLSMKRVMSFRSVREKEVVDLVDWVKTRSGSVINFSECVSLLTYKITCLTAFGEIGDYYESFQAVLNEAVKLIGGFNAADLFPSVGGLVECFNGMKGRLQKVHKEADQIFEDIIAEHKKRCVSDGRNEDLVDVLLKAQSGGQFDLSMDNVKAVIFDIFGAGTETSSTTMNWTMFELMKNPKVMQKAQAEVREVFDRIGKVDETSLSEIKYLKLVLKETFRLHPPVPLLVPRENSEKCEIKGYQIPEKTQVIINAYAIGRDPNIWNQPESFIPERFVDSKIDYKGNDFELLPFGAGRRMCPGMTLGMANVELPLAMLLYHFNWKLPNEMKTEDIDLTETFGAAVRPKNDLLIIPTPKEV